MNKTLEISGKTVSVYYDNDTIVSSAPVVYLHTLEGNAHDIWQACHDLTPISFTLISILLNGWNDALTPWKCEGLFAEDEPFQGNARQQLAWLESAVPAIEGRLDFMPSHRIIAGYSLAGLFATWAPFNTMLFDATASASGSLWYPGFDEYAQKSTFTRKPICSYFSLGSKETRTPSRLLRNVAKGTNSVVSSFKEKGVEATFESNPGNHFKEPDVRMAKGISWTLQQLQ